MFGTIRIIFETGTLGRKRNISATTGGTPRFVELHIYFKKIFLIKHLFPYTPVQGLNVFSSYQRKKKLEARKVVDDPRNFLQFFFGKKNPRDGIVDWKSKCG